MNWVQCDRCELWFHLLCVGLAADEVSENEDYVCFQCQKSVRPPAPTPAQVRKPPKPKKPVDEAVTKSYQDFLNELDMDQIGKDKLETMEGSSPAVEPQIVPDSDEEDEIDDLGSEDPDLKESTIVIS